MNKRERYTMHLANAAMFERQGRRIACVGELDRARQCTNDADEVAHLIGWRERLVAELRATPETTPAPAVRRGRPAAPAPVSVDRGKRGAR